MPFWSAALFMSCSKSEIVDMQERLIVYTAAIGYGADPLPDRLPSADADERPVTYVAFGSGPTAYSNFVPPWQHDSPRRMARRLKLLSNDTFPSATWTLWHDATHRLLVNPWSLVDYVKAAGHPDVIATFNHPQRQTITEEAEACIKLKKDDPALIHNQLNRYRTAGYRQETRLLETSVVIRSVTSAVRSFESSWWGQLVSGSVRDQLSLPWAVDQHKAHGLKLVILPGCREHSPGFRFQPHGKKPAPLTVHMQQPEIALIQSYLKPTQTVLEYGAGGSTLHFSRSVRNYHSVEHDQHWYCRVRDELIDKKVYNVRLSHIPTTTAPTRLEMFDNYINHPRHLGQKFDVILIDGRERVACARVAEDLLAPGGVLLVHDFPARPQYSPILDKWAIEAQVTTGQTLAAFRRR